MELENIEQFKEFINQNKVQAVAWVSTWCPPCKMLKPILYEYIDEYPEDEILLVNTDNFKEIAKEYDISHVPQITFFKAGNIIENHEGYIDYDELRELFLSLN